MRLPKSAALGAAAIMLLFAAPAASASAVTPTITQFSQGLASGTEPESITAGPEDALWFGTHTGNGTLNRSTLAGGISSYATLDGNAVTAMTVGPEGDIWFVETGGGAQFGKLEPVSGLVSEYAEPSSAKLIALAFGPEHELWFAGERGAEAELWRLNPSTAAFTGEYKIPTSNAKPLDLVFGSEGDVWFTESSNPGAIGGFEPGTKLFAEFPVPTVNGDPNGIAAGVEGDIYFTETSTPAIGRFNPMTHEVKEFTAGLGKAKPQQIVAGADGALYFTDSAGAIGRMTSEGTITEFANGLEKTEPWGIADGPDGNVWFTEKSSPARIGRITLAPGAIATGAENITSTSASLAGKLAARAQGTSYFFEYGATSSYGEHTAEVTIGPEVAEKSVAVNVSGLSPSSTYHVRLIARNATGITYSADHTFATGALAPVVSAPGKTLAEETVFGSVAGAAPVSGTVLVQDSAGKFVALSGPQTVPVGAVIDATKGTVRLITALPKKGKTQAVKVWGGRFKLTQSKHGNGLTKIILDGALPSCSKKGSAHTASKKGSKKRKLWAEDHNGRYSTYGANSVATVLGTEWETTDSCAGTLTRVLKGRVRVRDVHTKKTVVVSAGHHFLARP